LGTVIIGMSYDLQHVPLGGVVGCQVLQGIEDGFCGCLTTVSTWVSELSSLRRRNAYRYGAASVIVALCFLIVIMGSMLWTRGFSALQCTH
jgi:CrcB protein